MATKIEWTEKTWNPVTGCTKISKGCECCYIERTIPFRTTGRKFDKPGIGGTTGVTLHPDRLDQVLRMRKPSMIFVCSMADLFHDEVPDEHIIEVFARMWWVPQHVFQVLTKRPARLRALMPRIEAALRQREPDLALVDHPTPLVWPLPNVWVGVSVENQDAAYRIPVLLEIPAAVRWLSCEPLIGPLDLSVLQARNGTLPLAPLGIHYDQDTGHGSHPISWVVVGGESGPGASPMHPDWARSLRDQCIGAGVPFFFKQWGAHRWVAGGRYDQATKCWVDHGVEPQRVGKKSAGRELDGRTWDEYPAVTG